MNGIEKNTADCPIRDLLYLIRQEEIESLRSALLDTIDIFQPGGEIYLYEQGYSLYHSDNKVFSPNLLDFRSKATKQNVIEVPNTKDKQNFDDFKFLPTDDYVQVFNVESERSSRGLLITINKNMINEDYVNTLLAAYNNQVHLLRNKDTDSLTGLYNRRSLDTKLAKVQKDFGFENRSNDEQNEYYFALLDIDFFKRINDEFGHVYGDEVLLLFSNAMKSTFRDIDLLFRYGGEEFALLLKNVNSEQTHNILNRFRKNIEDITLPLKNKVTVSIGFCSFTNKSSLTTIIERADKALYYSKENGRNKVTNFDYLLEKGLATDTAIDKGDVEIF